MQLWEVGSLAFEMSDEVKLLLVYVSRSAVCHCCPIESDALIKDGDVVKM